VSDPLARAKADLVSKERELKDLQTEIDRLRSFIDMYNDYASNGVDKRSKKDIIADAAIAAIKENGPMHLSALFEAIEESGVEIGTQNPKQYLSTTLNRDDRFVSIEGEGWSVSSRRKII
jgi:hypothetical protein